MAVIRERRYETSWSVGVEDVSGSRKLMETSVCEEFETALRMAVMRSGDSRAGISLAPRSSTVEWRRVDGSWSISIVVLC